MPYTETELYTFGIIQEKMIEKAQEAGFFEVSDMEDAFNCLMWKLDYLETIDQIRQYESQLAGIHSEKPEGTAHLDQLRRDAEETENHLVYLSKELSELRSRKPKF